MSSRRRLNKKRELHFIVGHPAALLKQSSQPAKKVTGKGFAYRVSGKHEGAYYTVLENMDTGERVLMRHDKDLQLYRRWHAVERNTTADGKPGWEKPLIYALVQTEGKNPTAEELNADVLTLQEYFRSYDDLVASVQLFNNELRNWRDNENLTRFVLSHDWDGSGFCSRPPLRTIPYNGERLDEIRDLQAWYEDIAKG